ncbi:cell adhesion molecule 1 isoform X2 [Etheostoma spectabile]|uniref:Neurexin/syndecan/glycophorin C domain-containing protein n=2 Tax=Etheostoma spectabile TaxID=54343 RepID=A0A5J5CGG3_9PERO|nr:cell adhesion molecule 1-like isoform X2 [Etheostoma spectabile]KAA8579626.1 hypothetical protein FQN60_006719 [Etheostoma spectabile]
MEIHTTPTPATPPITAPAAETRATFAEVLTEMVTTPAPSPAPVTLSPGAEAWTPLPLVTEAVTKGIDQDDGAFAPLIGGIVCIALLLVICIILVLLWHLSRHKGSYITNEMDDEDMDDEESVGSDTALQSRGPLETKEDV